MKIIVEQVKGSENEIILRCDSIDDEMLEIMALLNVRNKKLSGQKDGSTYLLDAGQVLYCESVDAAVFLYTEDAVYKSSHNLAELEDTFADRGFLRCSKSVVLNLNAITCFRSQMGNRIDATLKNGEHIVISRHYARLLREELGMIGEEG